MGSLRLDGIYRWALSDCLHVPNDAFGRRREAVRELDDDVGVHVAYELCACDGEAWGWVNGRGDGGGRGWSYDLGSEDFFVSRGRFFSITTRQNLTLIISLVGIAWLHIIYTGFSANSSYWTQSVFLLTARHILTSDVIAPSTLTMRHAYAQRASRAWI